MINTMTNKEKKCRNEAIYSQENPKIGVAVIVVKEGKILVGYDGFKNKYSFPGGIWADKEEETTEKAAEREVFEETGGNQGREGIGIKCKNLKKLYEYTFFREDENTWYKSIGFTAEVAEGIPGNDPEEKRSDWQFMDPLEALRLDLFEPAKNGLQVFLNHYPKYK